MNAYQVLTVMISNYLVFINYWIQNLYHTVCVRIDISKLICRMNILNANAIYIYKQLSAAVELSMNKWSVSNYSNLNVWMNWWLTLWEHFDKNDTSIIQYNHVTE